MAPPPLTHTAKIIAKIIQSLWHLLSLFVFSIRHILINQNNRFCALIPQGSLVIVAIISHEEAYLREFVEFHLSNGVDYFVFYDNSTNSRQRHVLSSYIAKGKVHLYRCPPFSFLASLLFFRQWITHSSGFRHNFITRATFKPSVQEVALWHFHFFHRSSDFWIIHIDIDEFIYNPNGLNLKLAFDSLERLDIYCVSVPEYEFGSSYRIDYPDSVISGYPMRSRETKSFKSCGRSLQVSSHFNVHSFSAFRSFFSSLRDIRAPLQFSPNNILRLDGSISDCLRINHYKSKCLRDLLERRFLPTRQNGYCFAQLLSLYAESNEIECHQIQASCKGDSGTVS